MSPEALLRYFDALADAPDGVQRLREIILQLAVRGKLVPQDPGDEPASVLLERIEVEKARLYEAGEIRKPKKLPPVGVEAVPSPLPGGWTYFRLTDIGEFRGGATPSKRKAAYWGGSIPWVSPKDMKVERIIESEDAVTQTALEDTSLQLIPPGSLLIVARSGILRRTLPVSINDVPCTVNQDLKALIPYVPGLEEFLRLVLKGNESLILRDLVKDGVTVQSLKFSEFASSPFPLPPMAEQHRIVAKVDQLMALCDKLEAKLSAARMKAQHLAASVVHRMSVA